jgi:hypothetical protein
MTVGRIPAVLAACGALTVARIWVSVAPGTAVRWASGRSDRASVAARSNEGVLVAALARAVVGVGARRPFRASCLEQSLALVTLLSMIRIPAHLVVGVSRSKLFESLRAHAWVESRGDVLIGDFRSREFAPILPPSRSTASSCPG